MSGGGVLRGRHVEGQAPDWIRDVERVAVSVALSADEHRYTGYLVPLLCREIVSSGQTLHSVSVRGCLREDADWPGLLARIGELGGWRVHAAAAVGAQDDDEMASAVDLYEAAEYAWPRMLAHVLRRQDGDVSLEAWGAREDVAGLAKAVGQLVDPRPRGSVHVLASEGDGFVQRRAAILTKPLEAANYAAAVLDAYRHAVADLASPAPCGRFVLVDGPPGTGKTYLVRGLVEAVPGARFLVVPAATAAALSGPALLPVLMRSRDGRMGAENPLVLVIEDADACLVPRQTDNMDAISSLLNLSDGIVGAALNLRIVATTNARHREIDPALLRPGRLCRRIEIGPLDPGHAAAVHRRICGGARRFEREQTLAEVYAAARDGAGGP